MFEQQQHPGHMVRLLGFWGTPTNRTLPDPAALIDLSWDVHEREVIAHYLDHAQVAAEFMGASRCRLCSRPNGSSELTDGVFLWPDGLSHYVAEHSVRLPAEFIAHVWRRLQALDQLARDVDWWQNAGTPTDPESLSSDAAPGQHPDGS